MADKEDLEIGVSVNATKAESGGKRAKAAISSVEGLSRDLQRSYRALKSSIDPTFAAQEKYNKSIENYKKLLAAGVVTRKEYNAAVKATKKALEDEVTAIAQNSAAFIKAAAAKQAADAQATQKAKENARAEQAAAQETARIKAQAARDARRVQKQMEDEQARAVKLAAQAARLAASQASRSATRAGSTQRGVAPGSMPTDQSIAQLEYKYTRAYNAAQAAAERSYAAAAAAAEASNTKQAQSAQARAEREKALAEDYMNRAIQLRRTILSATGQIAQQEAAEEKAAREQEKAAARDAAQAAVSAAKAKKQADKEAAAAADAAAKEVKRLAQEEKQAAEVVRQMRASIDPAFAAQERYNETMRLATQLLMQNKLQQGEWIAIQKQAKAQQDVNVRSMGRMNSVYVQLGYQAQDVTASLASGINPLVILAQQGGQTASALSQMGGKMGSVAAFMAGPWGAAILGATMALGFLWQSLSEGEQATKDVMREEDRRKMTVKELTEALRDYTRAQEDANNTTMRAKGIDVVQTLKAQNEAIKQYNDALASLKRAQDALDFATQNPAAGGGEAIGGLALAVTLAQRKVDSLRGAFNQAVAASTEARLAWAQEWAGMTETERQEQNALQAATDKYRATMKAAGGDAAAQAQATRAYAGEYQAILQRFKKLKEQDSAATRQQAKDEAAVFQTRQQAIVAAGRELQKSGYNISENVAFGGVKGNHPGMGNTAHGQYAIDINMGKGINESQDAVLKEKMDRMVAAYQARGFRVLWNGKVYNPGGNGASYDIPAGQNQHKDHAHMEAPASIVGKSAGSSLGGQLANAQAQAQEQARKDAHDAAIAELDFQQQMAGEDLATVLEIQDKKIAAIKAFYGQDSKEALNAQRDRVRIEQQLARETVQIKQQEISQKLAKDQQYLDQRETMAEAERDFQTKINDFLLSNGMITEQEALRRKAVSLQQQYEAQQQHEEAMYQLKLKSLQDQLALDNLLPSEKRRINQEIETAQLQHEQSMFQVSQTYANGIRDIQLQAAQLSENKWQELGKTLESSLGNVFNQLWARQISFMQAFVQVGDAIVNQLFQAGAKAVSQWIIHQAKMLLVKKTTDAASVASTMATQTAETAAVTGATAVQTAAKVGQAATESGVIAATTGAKVASEAIKTGAAVSGAATQTAAAATAGTTEIATNAAVAAAGAYKSTVVIPFIGPVAAPAAAALALAAVMGFGALISARGGQERVPYDGQMTELHKDEMVLPAYIASPLRKSLSAPSSTPMLGSVATAGMAAMSALTTNNNSSGDVNFHYAPKTTMQNTSLDEMLRSDGRTMRKWLKNEIRNGALSGLMVKR